MIPATPVAEAAGQAESMPVRFTNETGCDLEQRSSDSRESCNTARWSSSSSDDSTVPTDEMSGEYDVTETGLHALASCVALLAAAPNADKGQWLGALVRSSAPIAHPPPATAWLSRDCVVRLAAWLCFATPPRCPYESRVPLSAG